MVKRGHEVDPDVEKILNKINAFLIDRINKLNLEVMNLKRAVDATKKEQ